MNYYRTHAYADGRAYAAPRAQAQPGPRLYGGRCNPGPLLDVAQATITWPQFWDQVCQRLCQARFRLGTLRVHRQVLRSFKAFLDARWKGSRRAPETGSTPADSGPLPRDASPELAEEYIHNLVAQGRSASWLATNIAVLRTAFDKLAGRSLTRRLRTPRRPDALSDILAPGEIQSLIAAAPTARDRLIIGLLYGCGLKVGELCALQWKDVEPAANRLHIRNRGGVAADRWLAIPDSLLPILSRGAAECPPTSFVFPGRSAGKAISARHVERRMSRLAHGAGLLKTLCCMTLRHSYAVARLRAGDNIRDIQESLGHRRLETTLAYERYLAVRGIVSPAERLNVPFPGCPIQTPPASSPSENPPLSTDSPASPPEQSSTGRPATPLASAHPVPTTNTSPVPAFDAAIDMTTTQLPFPEISGGWPAFLAWFKTRLFTGP